MFEAIHGSAPDIAGLGIANPSGLLNGAIMMLVHLGHNELAAKITNAWLKTLEDGIHTGDIYNEDISTKKVNTDEFADAVIERLGENPEKRHIVSFGSSSKPISINQPRKYFSVKKELIGVDVFLQWDENDRNPNVLGNKMSSIDESGLRMKLISNRGIEVYPGGNEYTFCTDHWRLRYVSESNKISMTDILKLQEKICNMGFDIIKTENLYKFDNSLGFSGGLGNK
jgi:isocitrate dehydrogenase